MCCLLLLWMNYELIEFLNELLVTHPLSLAGIISLTHALQLIRFWVMMFDFMELSIP